MRHACGEKRYGGFRYNEIICGEVFDESYLKLYAVVLKLFKSFYIPTTQISKKVYQAAPTGSPLTRRCKAPAGSEVRFHPVATPSEP